MKPAQPVTTACPFMTELPPRRCERSVLATSRQSLQWRGRRRRRPQPFRCPQGAALLLEQCLCLWIVRIDAHPPLEIAEPLLGLTRLPQGQISGVVRHVVAGI